VTSPYNRSVFAELLERARGNQGLTQAQLGSELGLGQQAVSRWEAGQSKPRPAAIAPLAKVLGISAAVLMAEAGYLPNEATPLETIFRCEQILRPDNKRVTIEIERMPADPDPDFNLMEIRVPESDIPEDTYIAAYGDKLHYLSERDRRHVFRLIDEMLGDEEES
jgi:transcriptional regulator with XRE-family HTH domain